MIKLSKKVEYALIALQHISQKKGGDLTTARELSDKYKISYDLIGKILQNLARENFIKSVQGIKGGYFQARPIEKINLAEVIEAIEGPFRLTECIGDYKNSSCERYDVCNVKAKIEEIQKKMKEMLQNIYLGEKK